MDYSLQPDTLRCNRPVGTIQISNNTTFGYYNWQTTNGNITTSNTDSSQININKPGTYIVHASPAPGCPATRTDTIVIPIDTFPPVASIAAGIGPNFTYLQLFGGDINASNYATPFGGSQGLLWNWSGPNAFSSTVQNPTTDTAWGTYQLIVTEKRNGCVDTATKTLNYVEFATLAGRSMNLSGIYANQSILLRWQDKDQTNTEFFEIERSLNGLDFNKIGTVTNASTLNSLSFTDNRPCYGDNLYRIKSIGHNGQVLYSNIAKVSADLTKQQKFYLIRNYTGSGVSLVANVDKADPGTLVIYNIVGQILRTKNIQLSQGMNIVELPINDHMKNSVIVVSLFTNNHMVFSQKTIY